MQNFSRIPYFVDGDYTNMTDTKFWQNTRF